jgi:hypothetical protein
MMADNQPDGVIYACAKPEIALPMIDDDHHGKTG